MRVKYIALWMHDGAMSPVRVKLTARHPSRPILQPTIATKPLFCGTKEKKKGQKREEGGVPLDVPAGTCRQDEMILTFTRQESDRGGNGGESEGGSDRK